MCLYHRSMYGINIIKQTNKTIHFKYFYRAPENNFAGWNLYFRLMHFGRQEYNVSHFHAKLCIMWGFQSTSCASLRCFMDAASPKKTNKLPGNSRERDFEEDISILKLLLTKCVTWSQTDEWWVWHTRGMGTKRLWWVREPIADI